MRDASLRQSKGREHRENSDGRKGADESQRSFAILSSPRSHGGAVSERNPAKNPNEKSRKQRHYITSGVRFRRSSLDQAGAKTPIEAR